MLRKMVTSHPPTILAAASSLSVRVPTQKARRLSRVGSPVRAHQEALGLCSFQPKHFRAAFGTARSSGAQHLEQLGQTIEEPAGGRPTGIDEYIEARDELLTA